MPVLLEGAGGKKNYDMVDRAAFDKEIAVLMNATDAKMKAAELFLEQEAEPVAWYGMKLESFPPSVTNVEKILELIDEKD
jgi:hypothetical protein